MHASKQTSLSTNAANHQAVSSAMGVRVVLAAALACAGFAGPSAWAQTTTPTATQTTGTQTTGSTTGAAAVNTGPTPEVNIQKLSPTGASQGFVAVQTARQLPKKGFGIDLLGHYAYRPFQLSRELENGSLEREEGAIDGLTALNLRGAYGFTDWFELSVGMPVLQLTQAGPSVADFGGEQRSAGTGDLEASIALRPVSEDVVGLWLAPFITVPTGTSEVFLSYGTPTYGIKGGLSKTADILHFGVSAGFRGIPSNGYIGTAIALDDQFLYAGGLGFLISDSTRINLEVNGDIVVGGGRSLALEQPFKAALHSPVEAYADVVYHSNSGVRMVLGGGPGLTPAVGTPAFRLFAGLGYAPKASGDRDGDGIMDDVDECPKDPEDIDQFEDENGCPDFDNDQDTILDVDDNCPNDPEDRDGFQDQDGCPDPDNDNDSIPDYNDRCPNEPEDRDGFEDDNGCPDVDNDKDTILDTVDRCPMEPEDFNGIEDTDGCPDTRLDSDSDGFTDDVDPCPMQPEDFDGFEDTGCPDPDNDQDGIPDVADQCMFDPETVNGIDDEDGCPDSRVQVTKDQIVILDKVLFITAKAVIVEKSYPILNEVTQVLIDNPQIKRVRIEGHTDSRGSDSYNQGLSEKRAKAIEAYLIKAGVAAERLEAQGFGEVRPIGSNNTAEGREQNRRVEFHIVEQ